jgi:predicted Zn-dependent protease
MTSLVLSDNFLFHQRIIMETVHELGHAFGLRQ